MGRVPESYTGAHSGRQAARIDREVTVDELSGRIVLADNVLFALARVWRNAHYLLPFCSHKTPKQGETT
jgi:hypothetical protein